MIIAVTPNPALDVTYRIPALRAGEVHRVRDVLVRAGGKGINVARVLRQLGEPCAALGLGGGPDGGRLVAELRSGGFDVDLCEELPDVRRTLVVHADSAVTPGAGSRAASPSTPCGRRRRCWTRCRSGSERRGPSP